MFGFGADSVVKRDISGSAAKEKEKSNTMSDLMFLTGKLKLIRKGLRHVRRDKTRQPGSWFNKITTWELSRKRN